MYYCDFNHLAAKAKPPQEVRDPPLETHNSRASEPNYNNYNKRRKPPLHKFRSFRTSMQSTEGYSNVLLPMCKIQPTPLLYSRHIYPAASAASWKTLPRSGTVTLLTLMRI